MGVDPDESLGFVHPSDVSPGADGDAGVAVGDAGFGGVGFAAGDVGVVGGVAVGVSAVVLEGGLGFCANPAEAEKRTNEMRDEPRRFFMAKPSDKFRRRRQRILRFFLSYRGRELVQERRRLFPLRTFVRLR